VTKELLPGQIPQVVPEKAREKALDTEGLAGAELPVEGDPFLGEFGEAGAGSEIADTFVRGRGRKGARNA
jgi:hypothetical protein